MQYRSPMNDKTPSPELQTARFWQTAPRGTWRVYDGRGRLVAFDLTEERAQAWARTVAGGQAEAEGATAAG